MCWERGMYTMSGAGHLSMANLSVKDLLGGTATPPMKLASCADIQFTSNLSCVNFN